MTEGVRTMILPCSIGTSSSRAVDHIHGRFDFFASRVVKRIKTPVHVDRRAAARRDQCSDARKRIGECNTTPRHSRLAAK